MNTTASVAPAASGTTGLQEVHVRVMVLGIGVDESGGNSRAATAFPHYLARSLADRIGRTIDVTMLPTQDWDLEFIANQIRSSRLTRGDALVIAVAHRPVLALLPQKRWQAEAAHLRDVLSDAVGFEPSCWLLSPPWDEVPRAVWSRWGGLRGARTRRLATIIEAALVDGGRVRLLRLGGPVERQEWQGPGFSQQTHLRWANQVAAAISHEQRG